MCIKTTWLLGTLLPICFKIIFEVKMLLQKTVLEVTKVEFDPEMFDQHTGVSNLSFVVTSEDLPC